MERLADAMPAERAAKRWIVSTDPDEHVEKIRPYVEMGFRHLVFHAPGSDQARFLNLLCRAGAAALARGVRLTHARRCPMSRAAELRLVALPDFPQVASGDDLAALTAAALTRADLAADVQATCSSSRRK